MADRLAPIFGTRLLRDVALAKYTSARIGGPADALMIAESAEDLADIVSKLWQADARFVILGAGSNVLVSDRGCREVVLNHARRVEILSSTMPAGAAVAESGPLAQPGLRPSRDGAASSGRRLFPGRLAGRSWETRALSEATRPARCIWPASCNVEISRWGPTPPPL
jgi:UDP-N-acetylmuramate dehydrogenase